ncbi:hypothetical protein [Rhizorhapis suberifaciens]|uniref:Uncharacterized protein n=1 Tax=Rhizorhapis suberifaciens TaxID=13656 RepID=A0A840HVM9_9SPHN|nr:hypothetical protein [Rhizorhapis suberifaciens]MBB4641741.1 hypothetical protein [Rhizorhapis suberifaciens]
MIRFVILALLILLTAALVWLWWSDYVLIEKCLDHGGRWDADKRVCRISVTPPPTSPAFLPV